MGKKKRTSYRWNKAEIKQLVDLYESGQTMEQVSEEFGISRQRAEQILKKAGVKTRKFTVSDKYLRSRRRKRKILPKELLLKHYKKENLPISQILKTLNVSSTTFYKSLEFHNIPKLKTEGFETTKLTEDLLRRMYLEENLTSTEIARRLGYAPITIKRRLSKLGIRKGSNKNKP